MAYISQKERATIPSRLFGDPANKEFPARNQAEFNAAVHLIGKARNPAAVKRRLIAIAHKEGYTLPDAWT